MLLRKEIQEILKNNFNNDDVIMIHSSLKSIGEIEDRAEGLISELINYFTEGLVIFPTHSWATMKEDNQIFDAKKTPSCVGALTNVALNTPGFFRSMHPTHSVCAYGKNAKWYVDHDNDATTPVGENNCFGILKELNAKILFLGAPLSKNTFIHSIEEEYDVEDRFTEHIYHFISTNDDEVIDYYMPKHYSTLSAHISEHYEKLLPIFLDKGIGAEFKLGNATCYNIDAKKSYELVCSILDKDIHAFDDFKDITHLV